MERLPARSLEDLLPATKTVGNNQRVIGRFAHRRKEHSFAHGLGYRVLLFLKTERSRHSAASRIDGLQIGAHFSKQRFFGAHFHNRFVMAVPVEKYLLSKLRSLIARGLLFQKLAQEKRLVSQPDGTLIHGKQIAQFIPKDGSATRFQHDDRDPGHNWGAQDAHDSFQILFGLVEHAEIIERPAAAQMHLRNPDLETCALKYIKRRAASVRMKIIVERVRPQNHFALVYCGRSSGISSNAGNVMLPGPMLESGRGELRHASLRSQMQRALQQVAEARRLAEKVGDARSDRAQLRPAIDHPKGIGVQRTAFVLVIMS